MLPTKPDMNFDEQKENDGYLYEAALFRGGICGHKYKQKLDLDDNEWRIQCLFWQLRLGVWPLFSQFYLSISIVRVFTFLISSPLFFILISFFLFSLQIEPNPCGF